MKINGCPSCFSTEEYYILVDNIKDIFYVYCDYCGMRGAKGRTEKDAIELWNELRNKRYCK